jgi:ribosome biogenesis GTPase
MRKGDRHTTMVIPGDLVETSPLEDERVVIERVLPRSFVLERRTPGGRTKQMAANVDTLAIVAALAEPALHVAMVDRLVAFAEQHEVRALLAFTKTDLVARDPDLPPTFAADMVALYSGLGYTALLLQPRDGIGIDELRAEIAKSKVLLVGNSGVGKSSIFGKLGGVSAVGELSKFGRGKQTTTSARLFRTGDGFLIDSPGIGEFTLEDMTPGEATQLFVEMREPATHCRFADCRHTVEPACGIRTALAEGRIAASRYRSYREIIDGVTA